MISLAENLINRTPEATKVSDQDKFVFWQNGNARFVTVAKLMDHFNSGRTTTFSRCSCSGRTACCPRRRRPLSGRSGCAARPPARSRTAASRAGISSRRRPKRSSRISRGVCPAVLIAESTRRGRRVPAAALLRAGNVLRPERHGGREGGGVEPGAADRPDGCRLPPRVRRRHE